jgi:hypothetical protein
MDFFSPPERGLAHGAKTVMPHKVPYKVSVLAKAMERALNEIPSARRTEEGPRSTTTRPDWLQTFSE